MSEAQTVVTTPEGDAIEMPERQAENNLQAEHDANQAPPADAQPNPVPDAPEAEAAPEEPINEREAKLEAIAARRMQAVLPEEQAEEPIQEKEPEPETHIIKVNGEEQSVTLDELRALAQKGKAADRKFEEAANLSKSSEARIKELEDKLAQQSSMSLPNQDATKQPALPQDDGPMQFTPEALDRAVFSSDEESTAYREEMARRLNQQVNPTEIKEQIRYEMRIEQAIESVSNSDPIAKQMLSDSRMSQVVNEYSGMLLRLEPNLTEAENIAKAAKQARMHFPELIEPEAPPAMKAPKQVQQSKQAHSMGNVSAPAQRINVAPEPPTEAQLRAQARSQLRQGRGL